MASSPLPLLPSGYATAERICKENPERFIAICGASARACTPHWNGRPRKCEGRASGCPLKPARMQRRFAGDYRGNVLLTPALLEMAVLLLPPAALAR